MIKNKVEYKILEINGVFEERKKILEKLDKGGWQLLAIDNNICYLKREEPYMNCYVCGKEVPYREIVPYGSGWSCGDCWEKTFGRNR